MELSGHVQSCAGIAFTIVLFSLILFQCHMAVKYKGKGVP